MSPEQYHQALKRDEASFREALRSGDLSAAVPGCPGWSLADLGSHLGGVYRFATTAIMDRAESRAPEGPRERLALLEWFDVGWSYLNTAWHERDLDQPCWTLGPPPVVAFWVRRMCQETALHLWDANEALGTPGAIEPELAADGVREVLSVFLPRQVRLGRLPPLKRSFRIELTDVTGEPLDLPGDGVVGAGSPPEATVAGEAASILLLLWGRRGIDDVNVSITGHRSQVAWLLASPLTP